MIVVSWNPDDVIFKVEITILVAGCTGVAICIFILPISASEDPIYTPQTTLTNLHYLKIGSVTRECAYKIDALNVYLVSDVQTQLDFWTKIQALCTEIISECGLALTDVAIGLRTIKSSLLSEIHILDTKATAETPKAMLKIRLWHDPEFLDVVLVATAASLLIDIVACTAKISDSVEMLTTKAKFKKLDLSLTAVIAHCNCLPFRYGYCHLFDL
ncbi:hypothetical protein SASPL_141160 [Salvia splendens]|uniref:Uncharacterized protein n=1 Tax=Salvia splendens TaxID=180675 RepID=A0A8X8WRZ6_SALSN|nr:hypothetical protein SASPL_141160 [Salvia splendens]